jgi:hypothetical protein
MWGVVGMNGNHFWELVLDETRKKKNNKNGLTREG